MHASMWVWESEPRSSHLHRKCFIHWAVSISITPTSATLQVLECLHFLVPSPWVFGSFSLESHFFYWFLNLTLLSFMSLANSCLAKVPKSSLNDTQHPSCPPLSYTRQTTCWPFGIQVLWWWILLWLFLNLSRTLGGGLLKVNVNP